MPRVTAPVSPTLLDELMPRYDQRTMDGRAVRAPVERVADAIRATDLAEAHVARALFAVRTLGASLRRGPATIVQAGDGEAGFIALAAAERESIAGFAGRPWPGGGPPLELDAAAWRTLDPSDCIKVAMSVRCAPADYGTLLLTETRIVVGPLARTAFRRYWLLVRPGSGLVRDSLLRAIGRRAERSAAPSPASIGTGSRSSRSRRASRTGAPCS
jgi:hypothetical protein